MELEVEALYKAGFSGFKLAALRPHLTLEKRSTLNSAALLLVAPTASGYLLSPYTSKPLFYSGINMRYFWGNGSMGEVLTVDELGQMGFGTTASWLFCFVEANAKGLVFLESWLLNNSIIWSSSCIH